MQSHYLLISIFFKVFIAKVAGHHPLPCGVSLLGHHKNNRHTESSYKNYEYPWHATIFEDQLFLCNGALITIRHTLTLASCLSISNKGQKKSKLFFQVDVSSKEWMNKFYFTTKKPQVNLFCAFFGGNWRHQEDISNHLTFSKNPPIYNKLRWVA